MPKHATRTSFKPGKAPGPGRPRSSPELKAIRKLTKNTFEETANKFIFLTKAELSERLLDLTTPMLDHMVGKIIQEAVKHGDQSKLSFILDRLIGKTTEKHELTGINGGPIDIKVRRSKWLEMMSDPELAAAAAQVARKLYGDDESTT